MNTQRKATGFLFNLVVGHVIEGKRQGNDSDI